MRAREFSDADAARGTATIRARLNGRKGQSLDHVEQVAEFLLLGAQVVERGVRVLDL